MNLGEPEKRQSAGCPYSNGDEFAAAVIEEVLAALSSQESLIETPENAQRWLPKQTERERQVSGVSDQEIWSEMLMKRLWSHETRTMIVIAKPQVPLPYWEVKSSLEYIERRGEREGWLPYA